MKTGFQDSLLFIAYIFILANHNFFSPLRSLVNSVSCPALGQRKFPRLNTWTFTPQPMIKQNLFYTGLILMQNQFL